jgi:hypothetical protein
MSEETTRFDHESYGMVQFSRVSSSGNHRLFGSALPFHHHSVRLRVHTAYLVRREHGQERAWADHQIVEVELSAAQFSELLTTMNVGEGVPCTIVRYEGRSMGEPPAIDAEPENIRETLRDRLTSVGEKLAQRSKAVLDSLPSGTSEKARAKVRTELEGMAREITDHVPFALKMFQEATTRVSNAAKAEVDALLTHIVQATGLQVLRERAGLPALPESTTPTSSANDYLPPGA